VVDTLDTPASQLLASPHDLTGLSLRQIKRMHIKVILVRHRSIPNISLAVERFSKLSSDVVRWPSRGIASIRLLRTGPAPTGATTANLIIIPTQIALSDNKGLPATSSLIRCASAVVRRTDDVAIDLDIWVLPATGRVVIVITTANVILALVLCQQACRCKWSVESYLVITEQQN
jgi:hypothetical protein